MGNNQVPSPEQSPQASAGEHSRYPDRLDEVSSNIKALDEALNSQETLDTILGRLAETTVQASPTPRSSPSPSPAKAGCTP